MEEMMRKLLAHALGLGLLSLQAISIPQANAQAVAYPGSPGSPYTTGSLKRRKHAAKPHAQTTGQKKLKAKKTSKR
jgi:hypothetical protein